MRKTQPINFRPADKYVHQVLDEVYYARQKEKPVILKLPCQCVSIQVLRPGTIRPICPVCGKKYILKWQLRNKTITEVV